MQYTKSKRMAIFFALFLTISIAASAILVTNVVAHTPPYKITTYALVEALPHTTGVGQTVIVYAFLGNPPPPGSSELNTYRFHNYEVIFTAPSGKTETKLYETVFDTTGAQTIPFTPDEVGTYNITFNYKGQTMDRPGIDQPVGSANLGDIYLPSSSSTTLVVTQDHAPTYP